MIKINLKQIKMAKKVLFIVPETENRLYRTKYKVYTEEEVIANSEKDGLYKMHLKKLIHHLTSPTFAVKIWGFAIFDGELNFKLKENGDDWITIIDPNEDRKMLPTDACAEYFTGEVSIGKSNLPDTQHLEQIFLNEAVLKAKGFMEDDIKLLKNFEFFNLFQATWLLENGKPTDRYVTLDPFCITIFSMYQGCQIALAEQPNKFEPVETTKMRMCLLSELIKQYSMDVYMELELYCIK